MEFSLSIVIPLFNEEESVILVVESVEKVCIQNNYNYEIILVDDGSSDRTWELIKKSINDKQTLVGIKLRNNSGQTSAMMAGISNSKGDIIITMDGDLQNDPQDIPLLLEKLNEGYDIVSGWRKNRKDDISRVIPSKIANKLISITTGVHLHDYGCSLKAYRSECIKVIDAYGEMHRFFPALASMTGANVTEIAVNHHPRAFGKSKYGFERIFKVFADIISINLIIKFTTMPLKGFSIFSIPFILSSIIFGFLSVIAFSLGWTEGKSAFFGIMGFVSFMSGIHLIILGLLGELIVNTSDLTFTKMPEITKKTFM